MRRKPHKGPNPARKFQRIDEQNESNRRIERNKSRIEAVRYQIAAYDVDARKDERVAKSHCRSCFYTVGARLAGQAFTHNLCNFCGTEQTFSSTHQMRVCLPCASALEICRECLSDVHERVRADIVPPRLLAERDAFWEDQRRLDTEFRERQRQYHLTKQGL